MKTAIGETRNWISFVGLIGMVVTYVYRSGEQGNMLHSAVESVRPIPALINQVAVNTARISDIEKGGSPGLREHKADDDRRASNVDKEIVEIKAQLLRESDRFDLIVRELGDIKADVRVLMKQHEGRPEPPVIK